MDIVYSLPTPQEITIETETISEIDGHRDHFARAR